MKPYVNPVAKWLLLLATIAMIVLHMDFWNWSRIDPRMGALPIGLTYHAVYVIGCAVLMYCFVRYAWPSHLESAEHRAPGAADAVRRDDRDGH